MKVIGSNRRLEAFTLIELLVVMAIIMIMAALLLPALSQGRARARQIECLDHLRETGLAFHSFAHDHNSLFPMAVPANAGGTLESVQSGYQIAGDFYFSFRHFQALSNELGTPKLLTCPADTRLPAKNFAVLANSNLSYFIGVTAQYTAPSSILAGDRNVTNDWTRQGTLLHFGPGYPLRWTQGLHNFKGNWLLADGHVEQLRELRWPGPGSPSEPVAALALPSVKSGAAAPAQGAAGVLLAANPAPSPPSPNWPAAGPASSPAWPVIAGTPSPGSPGTAPGPAPAPTIQQQIIRTPVPPPPPESPPPGPKGEKKPVAPVSVTITPKPESNVLVMAPVELPLPPEVETLAQTGPFPITTLFWAMLLFAIGLLSLHALRRRLARARRASRAAMEEE